MTVPADPRTWYLVRHGETEWNADARVQGQWDSRLTTRGREHARSAARLLLTLGFDALFASPLGRVRETLAHMNEEARFEPVFDDRLKEWSAGAWSGERYADLGAKWPSEWAAWQTDKYTNRPPDGENLADLLARARSFVGDVAPARGRRIAIIGHGFMNRALAGVLMNLAAAGTLRISQANDIVIRIVEGPEGRIASHFVNGEGPRPGLPEDGPAIMAL